MAQGLKGVRRLMMRLIRFLGLLTLSLLNISLVMLGWWQGTKLVIEYGPSWITCVVPPVAWGFAGFPIVFFYFMWPLYLLGALWRARTKDQATPPRGA
jgi:hypothetical protein